MNRPTVPTDDLANQKTVLGGAPVARSVTRLGRYRLQQRLGVGGMAEVYLAEQDGPQQFKKRVVVKRILPSLAADAGFVAMFVREAQVAARLSHGNVVQIYELGEQRHDALPGEPATTEYFIAMEYIDGLTLQRLASASWNAGRALPIDVVVRTIADAARGLHAAHTLTDDSGKPVNLVHRDISPDNLMVSKDGVTKVLDFGIAKGELEGPKTRTGNLRGKVPYMSPEQIQGQPLDGRCDLWALGVSMYWLLCGERPFDRGTDFHTMQAVLQEPAKRPTSVNPGIPPALEDLILRLLEKDRAKRPATGAAVADELEEMAAPGTGSGRRTTVAFVEQFVREEHAAGNPLSESGDRTGMTRPLGAPASGEAVDVSLATEDAPAGARAPRVVTLTPAAPVPSAPLPGPEPTSSPAPLATGVAPSPIAAAATGGAPSPTPAPAPATPAAASGSHPVVDMLAQPQQSAIPAVLLVMGVMAVLLGVGGFGIYKLVQALEATPTSTPDAGAAVAAVDAGSPKVVDAGAVATRAVVDAGLASKTVDAGPATPKVVDAGPAVTPPPSLPDAGPAVVAPPVSNRWAVKVKAPDRIFWSLEDGTELGTGTTTLSVPKGTARVVADDRKRKVKRALPVVNGKPLDYTAITAGTLTVKQAPGTKVFLGRDLIAESTPVWVAEGTYEVRVVSGARSTTRKLEVKAGQAVVIDAAKP